jgi:hypothetical protein
LNTNDVGAFVAPTALPEAGTARNTNHPVSAFKTLLRIDTARCECASGILSLALMAAQPRSEGFVVFERADDAGAHELSAGHGSAQSAAPVECRSTRQGGSTDVSLR